MRNFEQWTAGQSLSKSSLNVYRTMWNKLERYCIGRNLPVDMQSVIRFCEDERLCVSQSRRYVMLAARVTGDETILKAGHHFRVRAVRPLPVALAKDQAEPLLSEPFPDKGNWKKARNGALLRTMHGAGLKLTEAIALEMDCFNFDGDLLVIEVRGQRARLAPAIPVVTDYLKRWLEVRRGLPIPGALAFPASLAGQLLDPSTVYRMVRQMLETNGIHKPHLGTGVLRNTFAVRQLTNEVPVEAVQDWIGHRHKTSMENLLRLVARKHGVLPR